MTGTTKRDRIARVITTLKAPEVTMEFGTSPAPLADALQRDFPDIEATARLQPNASVVNHQQQLFTNYAYHISLAWWMFLVPVLFVLATSLLVIGQQVIRAAIANPVIALRNE